MADLERELFVCIDCESTGLDPKNDRIVEIAAATFTFSEILAQFESLVNPECDIPSVSQEIHKISAAMLVGKPKIAAVLPEVLALIGNHIIVGHAINFDIELVASEAKRNQIPTHIQSLPFIDTLRLARLYGQSPTNSLEVLRQHFNIPPEGAHRAMSDVATNIEVFKYLAKPYRSSAEILNALKKPIRLKAMPLGKHKGRKFEEIPLEYLRWAERKDFDQDLLYSIRLELSNRKKGDRFTQSTSPFSEL